MCVNTYFDTICVHPIKSAYTLSKMRTVKLTDKLEFVYFFTILPTIHLINKIAPVIAATFNNETAIVVIISGTICSEGIVAYISDMSFFTHINTINATAITKTIIRHGSIFFLLLLLIIFLVKFLFIGEFIITQKINFFNTFTYRITKKSPDFAGDCNCFRYRMCSSLLTWS